jgi:hypothetical protein
MIDHRILKQFWTISKVNNQIQLDNKTILTVLIALGEAQTAVHKMNGMNLFYKKVKGTCFSNSDL